MAWTTKDSLSIPKPVFVDETGVRLSGGHCVLYRLVITCIKVDGTDKRSIVAIADSLTDGAGTVLVTLPFQRAGETVEIRFRNGLDFATGMGVDVVAGTLGDGKCVITSMYAVKKG